MILVTGGTGLVGSHLLYFLLKENKQVRAIYRKSSDIESVKKVFALYTSSAQSLFEKIDWAEADISDIPALSTAFMDIDTVYHCAAFISFNPSKFRDLKKVNTEGTANIVNLCLAHKIEKLCYVSSVATLGSSQKDQVTDEETPWNPDENNSVYAITKYGAEMEVWRGTQEGQPAIIVNPGIVLGTPPNDADSGLAITLGKRGIPVYPPGAMGVVDVIDVVRAMIMLTDSDKKNERYILVGQNLSFREILSKFAVAFNKKPPSKKLPKAIMYFLSGMDWLSNKLLGTKRRIVKATIRSMFSRSHYDASKIKNEMGFEFTPIDDTINRLVSESKKISN